MPLFPPLAPVQSIPFSNCLLPSQLLFMREGLSGAARGKIRLEGEPMAGYTMTMARPRIDDGDNAVKHPMGPDPADDEPQPVSISAGGATLGGELQIPAGAVGI